MIDFDSIQSAFNSGADLFNLIFITVYRHIGFLTEYWYVSYPMLGLLSITVVFIINGFNFNSSTVKPQTVLTTIALGTIAMIPIEYNSHDVLNLEAGITKEVSATEEMPLISIAVSKVGAFYLSLAEDLTGNDEGIRISNNAIFQNEAYRSALLSTYGDPVLADNVVGYKYACEGLVRRSNFYSSVPIDVWRGLGLFGGVLGVDPISFQAISESVEQEVVTAEDALLLLESAGSSTSSDEYVTALDFMSRQPVGGQDLAPKGRVIPTVNYFHSGKGASDSYMINDQSMIPLADRNLDQSGPQSLSIGDDTPGIEFYPVNCKEYWFIAVQSMRSAIVANLKKGGFFFLDSDEHRKAKFQSYIGDDFKDSLLMNRLASEALYDNGITDAVTGWISNITNDFKSISVEYNLVLIYSWAIMAFAVAIAVAPFIPLIALMSPGQLAVYRVYYEAILMLGLVIFFINLVNIVTRDLIYTIAEAARYELIESSSLSKGTAMYYMAVQYGSLLLTTFISTLAYMLVSSKLAKMSSGNSHVGETTGATTAVITPKLIGHAISAGKALLSGNKGGGQPHLANTQALDTGRGGMKDITPYGGHTFSGPRSITNQSHVNRIGSDLSKGPK